MGYRIVASGLNKGSELEQFAMWFHQDWGVLYSTFEQSANAYLKQLSAKRRTKLRAELAGFLDEHAGATRAGLERWWLKLGAQGGPRDLKDALQTLLKTI
jgi:hypothetical protein